MTPPTMKRSGRKTDTGIRSALRGRGMAVIQVASVAVVAFVIFSPLLMLIASSLKDNRYEIMADMGTLAAFWVKDPSLNNFVEVGGLGGALPFGRYLVNSIIILATTVTGGILVSSMLAFVLAWGKIPGRAIVVSLILALYVVPQETLVIPLIFIVNEMGLRDTYTAQILPWMASPIYIFLFYQFFRQVPKDLVEAALVDGASKPRIYWSVFMPISLPVVATVAILQGIESWNQYLWPLLVTQSDHSRPISVGIAAFFGQDQVYWDLAMASSMLMLMPILLLYIVFQRWFISSFLGSAVKG